MTVELDDRLVGDLNEQDPTPAPAKSKFPCRYCDEFYVNALVRFQHEKKEHGDEVAAKNVDKEDESRVKEITRMAGGIKPETLTEMTRAFIEAVDAAAPEMTAARRKQFVKAYDADYPETVRDLEEFLHDWSMSMPQIRLITRSLFPRRNREEQNTGWGSGQQSMMAMDPTTGRTIPIIVVNGNGGQQSPQGPLIFQAPAAEAPRESLTKADVAVEVRTVVSEEFAKLTASMTKEPSPSIRRRQEPITNDAGEMILDGNGNVAMRWVEEPVNESLSLEKMLDLLTKFGLFGSQPKVLTPEEIAVAVTKSLPAPIPVADPQVADLKDQMTTLSHRLEMRDEVSRAVETSTAQVMDSMQPQLDELKNLRNSQGQTDHQASLAHEERLTQTVVTTLASQLGNIRDDLRPLVITQAASQLRQQGFSPQAIVDMVQTHTSQEATASSPDKVASALEKWTV